MGNKKKANAQKGEESKNEAKGEETLPTETSISQQGEWSFLRFSVFV